MAHCEPTEDVLVRGSTFAAYTIDACIGEGGMARVYRARHEALQRDVALKVMTLGGGDREGAERFLREARMAAAIKHRNVVNIFDVGLKDGVPFMVMELLDGEDVEARLAKGEPLAESDIVDMAVPVAAGLAAVHDAGIIHRDLKPGNIFLATGSNGEVEPKLLDFGISKSLARELGPVDAANAPLMGTPLYMAPEVLTGRELTPKSDQYSFGVVLYECATGVNPFIAETMDEVMRKVALGDVVPVLSMNPRISKALARIIERAMNRDPAERYPDLRAMGRDLLVLAGQRTRITWGLTFGDVGLSVIPHELSLIDSSDVERSRSSGLRASLKRAAPALGLLAAALAVGAVSMVRFWGPHDAELGLAVSSTPAPAAAPSPPSTEAEVFEATRRGAELAPVASTPVPEARTDATPAAPTASTPKERVRRRDRRLRASNGAVATPRASDAPQRSGTGEPSEAPEWALSAHVAPVRAAAVGTNNAPILE